MTWLHEFQPFSLHHLVLTVLCIGAAWLVIRHARAVRGTPGEFRVRLAWAAMTLLGEVGSTIVWSMPERYARNESWPIHLCDLAAWLTPYALLSRARWAKTLLFYWGLGLSTQGFLTPTVPVGLLSAEYWVFWTQHLGVVGGAVYLGAVNGYRPSLRDLSLIIAVTLAVTLAMVWVNVTAGTNYMYVGDSVPEKPTVIDHLGPWPGRIAWLCALGVLAFVLTHLGTGLVWRLTGAGPPSTPESGDAN
jgi:hypothetical integral membrane protein (TIGR02206 family)